MEATTGGGGVHVVSRRIIRPEFTGSLNGELPPEHETTVHLTPWDLRLLTVENIQKGILLPKPPTGGETLVEHLASSFARALGRFYPFAGRLAVEEVDDGASPECTISVSLRCNDEGAEFVHAVAPDVSVANIAASLHIPRVVWSFFPLNGVVAAHAATESLPVLSTQVTELSDGVFIAMSVNHVVGDGTNFWEFMNTWSEISRSSGGELDISPLPSTSTSRPLVVKRWFLDNCTVPIPLPFSKLEHIIPRSEHQAPVQECFFAFSAESIRKLKVKANDEMGGAAIITGSSPRFDVFGNDFGWGKPVSVRSGGANKFDGKVTVYEGPDGAGSMSLEVCLTSEALAKLVADEEFMGAVTMP